MEKISSCTYGWKQSDEKGASHSQRDACRHCGKTKRWHDEQVKEPELSADQQAEEFLVLARYKNSQFYELGKVLLTRYIEWKKNEQQ